MTNDLRGTRKKSMETSWKEESQAEETSRLTAQKQVHASRT